MNLPSFDILTPAKEIRQLPQDGTKEPGCALKFGTMANCAVLENIWRRSTMSGGGYMISDSPDIAQHQLLRLID